MKKLKVNISCPSVWHFEDFLKLHSPNQANIWGDFEFFLNQEQGYFDYWVVLEQLDKQVKLNVPKGNIWLVTMEEKDVKPFFDERFLNQFDVLLTSRSDVSHRSTIKSHYFTKWHIQKSYDQLIASIDQKPLKSKNLSAIISSRVQYGTHQKRYAFINKLKGHFKKGLDWYSKNENPIEDKFMGLADYKYSIAIENGSHSGYFTEKLVDVILADAVPFYWGDTAIHQYFPKELIKSIPLEDFEQSIEIIETEINANSYQNYFDLIRESKLKILNEYQFMPWLVNLLTQNSASFSKIETFCIYPETDVAIKIRLKNSIKQLIGYGKRR
jgi:Glycosyltransferase family 10 (fucosyltransferase) C-term